MWQTFHFLRPEWLYAIPVIAGVLFLFTRRSGQDSAWEKVCDPALLQYQLAQEKGQTSHSTRILHWIVPFVFLLTIIALAGPSWEKKEQPVFQQGNALVIILDLSLSMNAKDIKPSRVERAKLKIIDILKQKKEGQSALIAFAGDAHTVSPLTIDNKTIKSLLPALETSIMPLSGSHIVDALTTAKQLLKNAGFAKGDILLITDGIDPAQQKKLKQTVKKLYQQGYYFSAIGVGSQAGSPIPLPNQGGFVKDENGQVVLTKLTAAPLKSLAQTGGGSYHPLSLDDDDFKAILDKRFLDNEDVTEQENQLEQWVDAGVYITILLIPVALLAFRKGLLSIIILLLIPAVYTEPAVANTDVNMEPDNSIDTSIQKSKPALKKWNDLWATPDQQGQKAFQTQDYQQAAESFSHTNWKGSAYYRAGDFEKALQEYEQSDDASSLYNKANVLANLQKFQEAIDTYDEALKLDPQLEDAEKNRDYLQELLTQQEQQSGQDANKQQDQQQKKSDQQSSEAENQDQQSDSNGDSENSSEKSDSESSQSEEKNNASGTDPKNDPQDADSDDSKEKNSKDKGSEQTDPENDKQQEKGENETSTQEQGDPSESDMQQQNEPVSPEQAQQLPQQTPQEKASEPEQSPNAQPQEDSSQEGTEDVLSQLSQEEQQSLKQWLQRIPDNPGELLRIKFRNNSILKQQQQEAPEHYKGNPW